MPCCCSESVVHEVAVAGFLYCSLSGPIRYYITVKCRERGKSVRSWCDGSSDRSFIVDPLSNFSFQPVLHDWWNKCHGMCYPVYVIVRIKTLAANRKESPCGGRRFPLTI